MWRIIDKRTGRHATVAGYFTEARARRQIEEWRERHAKGGRPDITADMLDNMEAIEE